MLLEKRVAGLLRGTAVDPPFGPCPAQALPSPAPAFHKGASGRPERSKAGQNERGRRRGDRDPYTFVYKERHVQKGAPELHVDCASTEKVQNLRVPHIMLF